MTKPAVKHATVTFFLFGLLIFIPFVSHATGTFVLLTAITMSAWLVGGKGRQIALAIVSIGAVAAGLLLVEAIFPELTPLPVFRRAGWIVGIIALGLLLYCASVIVISLLQALDVSVDEVAGAVNVYLIIAFLWAHAYHLLEHIRPGSFGFPESSGEVFPLLVYFSVVTLTTLGYGDIVPQNAPARALVTLEAILGQIYVPVVVGYLLSLHISRKLSS